MANKDIPKNTFRLSDYGKRLWTREKARDIRTDIEKLISQTKIGDSIRVDCSEVEVFDFSFASELFAVLLLRMPNEYPDHHLVISGLKQYPRENLEAALEAAGVIALEQRARQPCLIGKFSPTDQDTLQVLGSKKRPIAATELAEELGIAPTAANERLVKLAKVGLIRKTQISGRTQQVFSVPK